MALSRRTTVKLAAALLLAAASQVHAADLLATVKARGTLKIATEGTYPPFNYKDAKTGELQGYDVDVAKLVAGKLGLKPEFVTTEWASILAGLASGKYDVIVAQVTVQPKRELAFDFSTPYTYSAPQLIQRRDDKAVYASLADLKGKKVGVGQGSVFEQQAKAAGGIDVRSYPAAPENLRDLSVGRIDAALNDSLMTAYLLKTSDLPIRAGAKVGTVERAAIPIKKGNPEFKAAINKALAEAAADGSLKAIAVKWFGTDVSKAP
ncbi:transporter substrate-binding domain-containing protein [Duganella sp. FT92W]|uniref:Transporter substrate-binding domain-containing protein n=1 Tax=Pseudoduganella rivuli TaxID=2666085 RepID=A0A7X2IRH5_9BURK|nr:transporter substrate-binding domain-containing protein [Pseudoduganella rivuli]MRV74832.1 transporter substrate-binding domain-containing protein [Pseudoduganella rivuli]